MASSGFFSSNVSISFSYKKETKNDNIKELEDYIKNNQLTKEINLKEIELKNYFGKENIVVYTKSGDTYNSKDFDSLEEFIENIHDAKDEGEIINYFIYFSLEPKDLEYVNLNILTKFNINQLNSTFRFHKVILEGYTSIYCGKENEIERDTDLSTFQELLQLPYARLELYSNASAY